MEQSTGTESTIACRTCGLVQRVGPIGRGRSARCARCGFRIAFRKPNGRTRTAAFALTALILYVPANLYPIVGTDYWGAHTDTRIIDAVQALFNNDAQYMAALVATTSVITPAFKIIGLLFLACTVDWHRFRRTRVWVFKIIEFVDPWNILEVTVLSMLVAIATLGQIAAVRPGAGVFSFAGVVVATVLASVAFDPRLVWDAADESRDG